MTLSDSPPSDRDAQARWLIDQEERIAVLCRAAMRRIIVAAFERFVGTITAAGDLNELTSIDQDWLKFVHEELTDELGAVHLSGSMTAWLGVKGDLSDEFASQWAKVVNHNAESYMSQHLPKLVGVGNNTANMVKGLAQNAISSGLTNEQLKGQIEKVTLFSEFRADTVARTETIGAYVNGDMAGARALGDSGPVEKVWVATLDKRTRETHAEAHNQCVLMDDKFDVGGVAMDAPHDEGAPAGEVVNCRCYVEMLYVGDTRPDGSIIEALQPALEPDLTSLLEPERIVERVAIPAETGWKPPGYHGSALSRDLNAPNPGGGHAKYVLRNSDGQQFLFKPMDEWVAQGESAASHIGQLAGLDDLPTVMVHQFENQWGSLQEFIPNARPGFKGAGSAFDPRLVTKADRELVMSHRPLDWLIGNHDAHVENWVREGFANAGGPLHGIDKGQAFKLFGKDKLSYLYNPNSIYGQSEPLYNVFERKWAKGELPQEFGNLFSSAKDSPQGRTLNKIREISDADYRGVLRGYAEGRFGGDEALVNQFLDDAVARKNGLDKQFSNYFYRLNNERKTIVGVPKPPRLGGAGGPTGMANAVRSRADATWMAEFDHPIAGQTAGSGSLSSAHEAVRTYSGSSYSRINSALRSGKETKMKSEIASALGPVKKDMIVTRGTDLARISPNYDIASLQGNTFVDRAFVSTTAGRANSASFSGDTLLHIKVPAGTPGAWIKAISNSPSEDEFLLGHDLTYYVHSVRRAAGTETNRYTWVAEVEIVSKDWAVANSRIWDAAARTWITG